MTTSPALRQPLRPSQGGELSSFKVTRDGQMIELLYNARNYNPPPGTFHGRAPLLWPAVGAQYPVDTVPKESCGMGSYKVGGQQLSHALPRLRQRHALDEVSRSADARGARVTVEFRDSDATRKYYPFAFRLDATFELANGPSPSTTWSTPMRPTANPMPFSIGNHLAFKIPLVKGSDPARSEVRNAEHRADAAQHRRRAQRRKQAAVLRSAGGSRQLRCSRCTAARRLSQPALLAAHRSLRLHGPRDADRDFTTLPEPLIRTNAYGGPTQGYFCPEPWFGVQNSLNTGVGLVKFAPAKVGRWRLLIEVEAPITTSPDPPGVERFGGDFAFTEGPVWVTKDGGYLLFSDIYNNEDHEDGRARPGHRVPAFTNAGNGNSMDAEGRLYTAERDGHRVCARIRTARSRWSAGQYEGKRFNSPNDVVVRRDGQVYFSDPASAAVLTSANSTSTASITSRPMAR